MKATNTYRSATMIAQGLRYRHASSQITGSGRVHGLLSQRSGLLKSAPALEKLYFYNMS